MAGTRKGFTVSYSSSYKNGIKMWENKITSARADEPAAYSADDENRP